MTEPSRVVGATASSGIGDIPQAAGPAATSAKMSAQVKKLVEANGKYKSLLKLAKERIQAQEDELETLRQEKTSLVDEQQQQRLNKVNEESTTTALDLAAEEAFTLVIASVRQRVKVPAGTNGHEEIWALFEWEAIPNENYDGGLVMNNNNNNGNNRRTKEWKRFDTESELQDFIRRDTGEPLILPPYSLSPEQSALVQKEASTRITQITEEFRRFRVKSELSRKQTESQIRDLQNSQLKSATQRGTREPAFSSPISTENDSKTTAQVERLRAEMAAQEAQWKESYNLLLSENNALKSAGSEALLASQWRHRYEQCLQERDALKVKLAEKTSKSGGSGGGDDNKYEAKYKELKESFKLYRKKAKEIFEEQQRGDPANNVMGISDNSSAESKLSYLKNLMVNYFTADPTVREHMEGAIATVLQFSPDEVDKIEKKRVTSESWF